MSRSPVDAARELLLALPRTEELTTHGSPTFKAGGKTMAYLTIDHHGDGRVALWLSSPDGLQSEFVANNPAAYFVPPYVGVKGWIGVDLLAGLPWAEVRQRVFEAWQHSIPRKFADELTGPPDSPAPERPMKAEEINPMLGVRAQEVLGALSRLCRQLPETSPENERASAKWNAGKKTFVRGQHVEGRLKLMFRVGAEQQAMLLEDPRYSLPMYYHSGGWIQLDVQEYLFPEELESLLETSYRHFALKRMIKALDEQLSA